ncbi:MAG: DDE-type integrase/transposase/recombinase [Chloroflexi bacterium]|nr:DDE-type integrase/transposase/recombinase [Chloroflexota bacterium]
MNKLSTSERAQIIRMLVEGNSIRSINRMTGFAQNTILKLLVDLGDAATKYQNQRLRNLTSTRIECDEIWAFVHAKAKHVPEKHAGEFGYGDVWTWIAIDPDTKLIPAWLVGPRDEIAAHDFIADLGSRLANRVQITTDGHRPYLAAIEAEFGRDVDYAMLIKQYGSDGLGEVPQARKYSPQVCTSQEVRVIQGDPDPARISTSYVERSNLTLRMSSRRFTRLTNAFSKKVRNHAAAVALQHMHYNFARTHRSLANPYPRTPAMAAGMADHIWTCEEIAALLD